MDDVGHPWSVLTVVVFGSDSVLTTRALETIAAEHRVVGVVQAILRFRGSLGFKPLFGAWHAARRIAGRAPLAAMARRLGSPHWYTSDRTDPALRSRLGALRPDLFCLAAYRWILPQDLLAVPRSGAINLHPSLLPRHRGRWPLFWTYYRDDRQAGVTLHRAVAAADAGPILAQEAIPLPRGYPVTELYQRCANLGAQLLRRGLADLAAGTALERTQDETIVTDAPRVPDRKPMIPFVEWDVERVWHFLAGLVTHYHEPLREITGRSVPYSAVTGYEQVTHDRPPGTVERSTEGWVLFARGGVVRLR